MSDIRRKNCTSWVAHQRGECRCPEPPECDYCAYYEPAVARVRWTVYGGALKSRLTCEKHAAVARGRRGVEVIPLEDPDA